MAESTSIMERYNSFVAWADEVSDPRTKGWFLVSSPYLTYSLILLYLLIVWLGPRFMASRKAFQLKGLMMIYNFLMVLFNTYLFVEFMAVTVFNPKFNLVCQAVDYSNDEKAVRLAKVFYWYFFSKLIEFADTFIFILRKKNSQVSFLHIYHHASMPALFWIGARWVAGGASYLSCTINSFVHILMYSYYFLSAMGPWIQPYLWWKRYLTNIQLTQFFLVVLHAVFGLFIECGFQKEFMVALVIYLSTLIAFFTNFYMQNYLKKRDKINGHVQNGHLSRRYKRREAGSKDE